MSERATSVDVPVPAELEPPPQGRMVELNGMRMYYEVHGADDAPPLLLLHGYNSCGGVWGQQVPLLAREYRVIVPDLRGHGRSNNPGGPFTHRQASLDVLGLLDHLRLERVRAMGISTGAMTLIHMATSQPSRMHAMVLIWGTIYFPASARQIMRNNSPDTLTPQIIQDRSRIHRLGEQQIRRLQADFHRMKDSYDDMNFTPPFLSTIAAPTLIVHGDRDEFFPVDIPVQMYQSIPNSYLWIIPNCGHGPWEKHGAEVTATAAAFLRSQWQR